MVELLHIEVSGKFNGRDAKISIDLDAEEPFEIEDVSTASEEKDRRDDSEESVSVNEDHDSGGKGGEDGDTDVAEEEPAGLDQLFPNRTIPDKDLPPLSKSSNQYPVAKAMYRMQTNEDYDSMTTKEVWEYIKNNQDEFEVDDSWDVKKVASNIYKIKDKDMAQNERTGDKNKKSYWLDETGIDTVKDALE